MFLDFGVNPSSLDSMSLAQLGTMFSALKIRRGAPPEISDEEQEAGMQMLLNAVRNDPSVRLN